MKKWLIFLFGIIFLISIVSADTNVSDIYIQTTSNITLGQKITFAFGEIIDNLIDGWMTITGNLDVRGFGNFSGTIYINNNSDISLFNETDRLNSVNSSLLLGNTTLFNRINSVNSSFLIANTSLYARIGVLNSTITNSNASWLSTYNATYAGFTDTDTNETARVNVLNSTILNSNSSWLSTFNSTYAGYDSTYNASYFNRINSVNASLLLANTTLSSINTTANIQNLLNSTGVYSTFNSTYNTWAYNQTAPANTYTDNWIGYVNTTGNIQALVDNILNSATLDGYDSAYFMPLNKSISGDFDFNGGWTDNGLSIINGDIYAQTGFFYNITGLNVSSLNTNGSIIPTIDNSFDLGTTNMRWRNLFLSGNINASGAGNNYFAGNVGIGTTGPLSPLTIYKDREAFDAYGDLMLAGTNAATSDAMHSIIFQYKTNDGTYQSEIRSFATVPNSHGATLQFLTDDTIGNIQPRMTIDRTGNIGIGTTNPNARMEIQGNASNGLALNVSSVLYVNGTSGNVGIGTTSSAYNLEVYKALGNVWQKIQGVEADRNAGIMVQNDANIWTFGVDGATLPDSFVIADNEGTGANQRLVITTTGNVGIGTTTPLVASVPVFGGEGVTILGSTVGTLELAASSDIDEAHGGRLSFVNTANSNAGASTRQLIAGISGAIETTDSNAGDDSGGHLIFYTKIEAGNTNQERMRITSTGNVGIGTVSPLKKLSVVGTINQTNAVSCGVTAGADGSLNCDSDERLKDIQGYSDYGLDEITAINPIVFNFKDEDYTHVGFSAQNVQTAIPEATPTQESGYLGLDVNAITATLVNSVKELEAKNQELIKRIEDLNQRLNKLENAK